MARKSTLAALDIAAEGLAQQDGLAERLARQRASRGAEGRGAEGRGAGEGAPAPAAHNAWRRGKALIQVAIPEEAHMELSILAKRRRITLSQLVKTALNQWLDTHGHALRLPD
jgi:hypothetical protein